MNKKQWLIAALILCHVGTSPAAQDALAEGFLAPPKRARPHVWWHWMNGNVSLDGALLDLEWMQRIGLGGVQVFEAGLGVPRLIEQPLDFMSPEWKRVLRNSSWRAARLGLDMSIAASPGWSETGGPWVTPAQSMKKLVWTETAVRGGRRHTGKLPQPAAVAGTYQDYPAHADAAKNARYAFYADAAVVAYRRPAAESNLQPAVITASVAAAIPSERLRDGRYAEAVQLAHPGGGPAAWIRYEFSAPVSVQSSTVALPGSSGFFAPPEPVATLEASDDGQAYRPVAQLLPTTQPGGASNVRSATFAPVSARYFRLQLQRPLASDRASQTSDAPAGVVPMFRPPPPPQVDVAEWQLHGAARVHAAEEKAGFFVAHDYYANLTPASAGTSAVSTADVIDLTGNMQKDGTLDWQAPAGDWVVLRLGYSPTGKENGPAPDAATGLEVDKLSGVHVTNYLNHYLQMYRDVTGRDFLGNKGITGLLTDSIESSEQNWTDDMPAQFRRLRGYELRPWLPALTGVIVRDAVSTDRFLWDFRRTIAQLLATEHYGTIADVARVNGLTTYGEALENRRPQLGDDMEMRRYASIPMGAMWMFPAGGSADGSYVADLRGAASVAHVYGKPLVAAEALTSYGNPWGFAPRHLKSAADLIMALGVNRLVIHESAHQPQLDRKPGFALTPQLGQYFNRNETWAEQAGPWIDYLARSSWLLQQGRFHADLAYFYGEDAPVTQLFDRGGPHEVPDGYSFDFVGSDAVLRELSARNGELVTVSGMRYRLLYLGGTSRYMTLPVLRKLRSLVVAGALVVGARPLATPSLADDEAEFQRLADELWGSGVNGRAVQNRSLGEALNQINLAPDWRYVSAGGAASLAVLHRRLAAGEIYFVSNRQSQAIAGELALRITGRVPELWHADTGARARASYRTVGGMTYVQLPLLADEAVFVVLREPTTLASWTAPARREPRVTLLDAGWNLGFAARSGAPASRQLQSLSSWSDAADSEARYFSGTATYTRNLTAAAEWLADAQSLWLDLGVVHELAEVVVNGRSAGIVWKPPFKLDLKPLLKAGENQLQVRVTNLWVNRLIGDAQPGAVPQTFTQGPSWRADAPLRPSGLLGPVRLLAE